MYLQEMTWPAVAALPRELPIIIPTAALEQHGHHLPLYTDSMLLGEVVRRTEACLSSRALFAPVMWLGNSHHHLDFPGTLSAAPRCYLDILAGLADNFVHHGFQRILLLNGHGGNEVPGKQALFELRQQYRTRNDLLFLSGNYWSLGHSSGDTLSSLVQSEMGHACEWETSMMLCLAPNLVGEYSSADTVEPGNPFRPASRAWITRDRTERGHIGCPKAASLEKGESLFTKFTQDAVHLIERMIDWDGSNWEG